MRENSKSNAAWKDVLCLTLGLGLAYFSFMGVRPFATPDEPRYAEISREMAATGDWITPRLNGVLYFEKPPLCYWMGALAIKVAGLNEATLRFWPAALGLLTCLVVYATGRRIHGRTAGLAAAVILGTTVLWFGLSQILTLDMAVSAFVAIALCLFQLAMREPVGKKRLLLLLGFYVCLALATLSKGLMGLAIPGAIIFLWTLLLNQWRKLFPLYLSAGLPLFLALAVPWHVMAAQATPPQDDSAGFFSTKIEGQGFFWYYIVHEQVLRYLTKLHERVEPFWFFFAVLPAGLFPWLTFLPQAVKSALTGGWARRGERREEWFYAIWVLFILFFFSTSQSKLIPYILPAYPALALLLGRFVARVWEGIEPVSLRAALNTLGVLIALAAVALPIALNRRKWAAPETMLPLTGLTIAGLILSACLAIWFAVRRDPKRGLLAPLICAATLMLAFNPLSPQVMRPSAKAVCLKLKPRLTPDTRVFCLSDYYQDVPVYLDRLVGVADDTPDEQEFGLSIESHKDRYLDQAAFLELWRGPKRIYAIMTVSRREKYGHRNPGWQAHVIFSDGNFVLLSNLPDAHSQDAFGAGLPRRPT